MLVATKLGSFASAVPFLHPPPPPPLWGSRVEKLKWQRGGRRWGWPGAPCRQPARPRSHRPAASPSVLPRGSPSPTGRQCPAAVPGPGRAVRVLPQERAQKWKSLVRNPHPAPLFIHSVGVSVQRGVAPSPGSFSRLGTGLCVHPGAPNLCVPGKRTAPPCNAAPRPVRSSSPRPPEGSPDLPGPILPLRRGQRLRDPHRPLRAAQPPLCPVPPTQSRGQVRGPGAVGQHLPRTRQGGETRGVSGSTNSPETPTFWLPPPPRSVSYRRRGCREPLADWLPPAHL